MSGSRKVSVNINNVLESIIRRIFDVIFSLAVIIVLSPVFIIVAILIKIKSPGGPVFYTQERLGLHGKVFKIYKFRSMIPNADKVLAEMLEKNPKLREEYLTYRKLKNDPRVIPGIGSFIRKYSIDELPQFFNVLLGDMSVVGPRPYIPNELSGCPPEVVKLLTSVKPGVTGYWQVMARNKSTFDERVKMDLEYIKKRTFWLDLKIIIQTCIVVLLKRGAY